jgi:hypothetical protein
VAAALADDPVLRQVILSGADIHDATARLMYGDGFTDEQRTISKRATFGTIYGGGARALASQTGVTEDTARQVIQRWRRTYPKVIAYGRRLAELAEVVTASGRRIPADPVRPYANANYAVQSTARDLLLAAVYALVTRCEVGGLWLFVHDEIIVQAPGRDAERIRGLLQQAMTSTFRGLPIVADAKILGPSWGQHNPAAPASTEPPEPAQVRTGPAGSGGPLRFRNLRNLRNHPPSATNRRRSPCPRRRAPPLREPCWMPRWPSLPAAGMYSRSGPGPRNRRRSPATRPRTAPAPTRAAAAGTPGGSRGPPPTRAASAGRGPPRRTTSAWPAARPA